MPNLNVNILGRDGNTRAKVTGQEELLVSVGSFSPSIGLATEATLLNVLTAVDSMRDYEVRLVEDSATPNKVTWLEVRYWDAQTGALGAPLYYLPGSSTAGSPVLPISYINPNTYLAQLVANTTSANRTPNFLRPTGTAGNTPAGVYSVSFASVGTANATVGGIILKPGETINFDGGAMNNTLSTIAYSTTTSGAELIITYLI